MTLLRIKSVVGLSATKPAFLLPVLFAASAVKQVRPAALSVLQAATQCEMSAWELPRHRLKNCKLPLD